MRPEGPSIHARPLALSRRPLLGLAAVLGLAGVPAARTLRASARRATRGSMTFEEFLAEAVPLAEDLKGDASREGQDRYLFSLGALAACLADVPVPSMRENTKDSPARTFIGANDCDAPFTVLHWRMEPGARLGRHPHIYGNVVTLLLEGEARVENHEMVGERDFETKEAFPVRRVKDHVLTPGAVNLVSLEHAYTHGFEAGKSGARGLDISTLLKSRTETPVLDIGKVLDEGGRVFEGRWRY